ncbi:MAG: ABC transporter ATP-binding protein [Actinobacteria bacterium]|nr:ABC transporter ATP-binding protein [Actinomycetota bacterium]
MIFINNINLSFDDKDVIKGLSLRVPKGERVAIVGPSGCGKSTLLRLIIGLITPNAGNIYIQGTDMAALTEHKRFKLRDKIGFLFQSGALFDFMTVAQNLAFPIIESEKRISGAELRSKIAQTLAKVGMSGYENKMPSSLSGGQSKRVALARLLMKDPEIILFDEPTTGLDPVLSTSIEDLMIGLSESEGITSVLVTHQISTIRRVPRLIYYMKNGSLLPAETSEGLATTSCDQLAHFMRGGQS